MIQAVTFFFRRNADADGGLEGKPCYCGSNKNKPRSGGNPDQLGFQLANPTAHKEAGTGIGNRELFDDRFIGEQSHAQGAEDAIE